MTTLGGNRFPLTIAYRPRRSQRPKKEVYVRQPSPNDGWPMRYEISLLDIYLRSDRSSSCWSRDMWRFDSTEHALVVGVPMGRLQAGSACVFGRDGGSWSQQHRVMASDGEPGDRFGFQVAVEGNAMAATDRTQTAPKMR